MVCVSWVNVRFYTLLHSLFKSKYGHQKTHEHVICTAVLSTTRTFDIQHHTVTLAVMASARVLTL